MTSGLVNAYNAPKEALVDFMTVTYAIWQCPGPGCGYVWREGRPSGVKPLLDGHTGVIVCGQCGQTMNVRKPRTITGIIPSSRKIHESLDRFRLQSSALKKQ